MERIQFDVVKRNFDDVIKLVGNAKQRIVVRENDQDRAALIPLEDLALLENLDGDKNVAVEHVSVANVKKHFSEDLAQVADREQRIVLQEGGNDLIAMVPGRDLEVLENLDSRLDIEAAKRLLQKEMDKDD